MPVTGIVDQDVDRAEILLGLLDGCLDAVEIGNVAQHNAGSGKTLAESGARRLRANRADHLMSGLKRCPGDGEPEPRIGASDEESPGIHERALTFAFR